VGTGGYAVLQRAGPTSYLRVGRQGKVVQTACTRAAPAVLCSVCCAALRCLACPVLVLSCPVRSCPACLVSAANPDGGRGGAPWEERSTHQRARQVPGGANIVRFGCGRQMRCPGPGPGGVTYPCHACNACLPRLQCLPCSFPLVVSADLHRFRPSLALLPSLAARYDSISGNRRNGGCSGLPIPYRPPRQSGRNRLPGTNHWTPGFLFRGAIRRTVVGQVRSDAWVRVEVLLMLCQDSHVLVAVVARIGIRGSMQPSRPIQSVPSCLVRMLSMRQVLAHAQVKTWSRRCGLQPVLRASTSTDNISRLGPRSVEARPVAKPHRDAYQVGRRQAQRHGVPASPHNKFFCVFFLLWFGRRRTGGRLGPDPRTIGAIVTAVTTASRPEMGRRTAPG